MRKLKQELEDKNAAMAGGMSVDVTQLEEQRKQAEQEKDAAYNALE